MNTPASNVTPLFPQTQGMQPPDDMATQALRDTEEQLAKVKEHRNELVECGERLLRIMEQSGLSSLEGTIDIQSACGLMHDAIYLPKWY